MTNPNILIFRIGSMGDTLISLPLFRKIRATFPTAHISLLTNFSVGIKACPMSLMLDELNVVDAYLEYPINAQELSVFLKLKSKIKQLNIDTLIYLMPKRSPLQLIRDWLFFKLCGIKKIIGLNINSYYQERHYDNFKGLWEHELVRLSKLISVLGPIAIEQTSTWKMPVSAKHHLAINPHLKQITSPYLVFSLGTKADTNDWGHDRWAALIEKLASFYSQFSLVVIGSDDEFVISQATLKHWPTLSLNLCGKLSPLESAAVLEKATLFIGHDSGPMHLAASVLTPVVAIFSAINKPGEWYPLGTNHTVIYHQTACFGCGLTVCVEKKKQCIRSITVDEVFDAIQAKLLV